MNDAPQNPLEPQNLTRPRTAYEARKALKEKRLKISDWSKIMGFNPKSVFSVLYGINKGGTGTGKKIQQALGLSLENDKKHRELALASIEPITTNLMYSEKTLETLVLYVFMCLLESSQMKPRKIYLEQHGLCVKVSTEPTLAPKLADNSDYTPNIRMLSVQEVLKKLLKYNNNYANLFMDDEKYQKAINPYQAITF